MGVDEAVGESADRLAEPGRRARPATSFRAPLAGRSAAAARSPPRAAAAARLGADRRRRRPAPPPARTAPVSRHRSRCGRHGGPQRGPGGAPRSTSWQATARRLRRLQPQGDRQEPVLLPRRTARPALMLIGEAPGRDEDLRRQAVRRPCRSAARQDAGGHRPRAKQTCTSPTSSTGARPETARPPRRRRRCAGPSWSGRWSWWRPRSWCCWAARRPSTSLDVAEGIMRIRGKWRDIEIGSARVRAIATLHPAYLLRTPAAKRLAWRDLLAIKAALAASVRGRRVGRLVHVQRPPVPITHRFASNLQRRLRHEQQVLAMHRLRSRCSAQRVSLGVRRARRLPLHPAVDGGLCAQHRPLRRPRLREAWRQMNAWLDQHQVRRQVKQGYGFFRDNPKLTAPELLRYDACVPVTRRPRRGPGGGHRPPDAAGRRLCRAHPRRLLRGAGSALSRSCTAKSCPSGDCRVDYDRPFMAIYLNDPTVTREVHRRTELCVPVLPVRMAALEQRRRGVSSEAREPHSMCAGRVPA